MSRLLFSFLVLSVCVPSFAGVELFPKVYEPVSGVELTLKFIPRGTILAQKVKVKKTVSVQFMSTEKSGGTTQYVAQVKMYYTPVDSRISLRQGDRDQVVVMEGGEEKQKDGSVALVLKPVNSRYTMTRGITVTPGDHGDTNVKLEMYGGWSALVHEQPVKYFEAFVVH